MNSDLSITLQQADEAASVEDHNKALQLYQNALELLHTQIQNAEPTSPAQQALITQFKEVLVKAELIKEHQAAATPDQQAVGPQAAPQTQASTAAASSAAAEEYLECKAQARILAEQAVAADGSGQVAAALQLYFQLLEVLNKCHKLETAPNIQAAIMARFQVKFAKSCAVAI